MEKITTMSLPDGLAGKSKIVFGNVRAILNFHERYIDVNSYDLLPAKNIYCPVFTCLTDF